MKYRTLAVFAAAATLAFSGTAFAAWNMNTGDMEPLPKVKTRTQNPNLPQQIEQPRHPEMPHMRSRDMRESRRNPEPHRDIDRDRKPHARDTRDRRDNRDPRDNRPTPPHRPHSRDKRPPELRR